ncbi:MAG: hypothetical protein Q8P55_00725 [bacterium]|nr:hypothetical protein [bacterium]
MALSPKQKLPKQAPKAARPNLFQSPFVQKLSSPSTKRVLIPLVIVGLLGITGYLFYQNSILKRTPEQAAQAEVRALVKEVGKIIVLPQGEDPVVATVSEPERLADQPFFLQAKRGDKVLIFTNAKKAFLYDPVAKRIIDVAPVNLDETPTESQGEEIIPTKEEPSGE